MAADGAVWRNDSGDGQSGQGGVVRVLVPVLDVLILVLGVTGHTLVMVILCGRHRRGAGPGRQPNQGSVTGTGTDTLLLALSAADLLLLAMLPFHTVAIALQHWPFGDVLCCLVSFLGAACSTASALTLAALAVTRYLAVVEPNRAYNLLTPRRVALAASVLWLPAFALASPQLAFRSVGASQTDPDGLACFNFLSHGGQLAYGVCHFLLSFALPLGVITVAYGGIYLFLWRSRKSGRAPQVERYQRKVTQTSALLVLAFSLCWLPSYGLTFALLRGGVDGPTGSPHYGPFSVFARLMATSSTVANPILYVLMSQKFRQDLLGLRCRGRA